MDKKTVVRECPVCGISYLANPGRLKFGRETTCSRRCSYAARAGAKKNKSRFNCSACGREMERSASQVKGKHGGNFCSRSCHYAGRGKGLSGRTVSRPYVVTETGREGWKKGAAKTVLKRRAGDNYVHSDETRAKLSKAAARAFAAGKIGTPSKLEDKVAALLAKLGSNFVRQFVIRGKGGRFAFVIDFWFPETRTALEVNGTYWHVDPRVYRVPINPMQARCLDRHTRKLKRLADLGVRTVELWEADFKSNPSQAVLEAYRQATRS